MEERSDIKKNPFKSSNEGKKANNLFNKNKNQVGLDDWNHSSHNNFHKTWHKIWSTAGYLSIAQGIGGAEG